MSLEALLLLAFLLLLPFIERLVRSARQRQEVRDPRPDHSPLQLRCAYCNQKARTRTMHRRAHRFRHTALKWRRSRRRPYTR